MKKLAAIIVLFYVVLPGITACAGLGRAWNAECAENIGSDWIVVQYRVDGTAFHCWKLHDTSIANEPHSDGIYWNDRATGHLVHVSGWYNRVQVKGGNYETAAAVLGVEIQKCGDGLYPKN